MSYQFIGENVRELKEVPAEERRKIFLKAVGRSYLHGRTWFGLLCFILASYVGATFSQQIADTLGELLSTPTRGEMFVSVGLSGVALLALYRFQIEAIKSEIRKISNPNQTNDE